MMRFSLSILLLAVTIGCGFAPKKLPYADSRVHELLAARAKVNTAAFGFTPPPPTAEYRLEGRGKGYDAMLHVYGSTSRTIAFRKTGAGYVWIGEQEIHTGPREFDTPDGKVREQIVITYETAPISGVLLNHLTIMYTGPRTDLPGQLSLQQAQAVLAEWQRP